MTNATAPDTSHIAEASKESMQLRLDEQKKAYLQEGQVSASVRHDRLERSANLLINNADRLVEAMNADFGHRSEQQSLFTDVAASIGPLRHAQKHLKGWMKSGRRAGFCVLMPVRCCRIWA